MIQALIATIVEMIALMFALSAGAMIQEAKLKGESPAKGGVCIILSLLLAACALGVASR